MEKSNNHSNNDNNLKQIVEIIHSPIGTVNNTNIKDIEKLNIEKLKQIVENPTYTVFDSNCVRKKSNWGKVNKVYKFDSPYFNINQFNNDISIQSPKLAKLLSNIDKLDHEDNLKYGKKFKHFIFSDLKGMHGAKVITSALISKGMRLGYTAPIIINKTRQEEESNDETEEDEIEEDEIEEDETEEDETPKNIINKNYGKITFLTKEELINGKKDNFYLLSSVNVYDQNINVSKKKEILTNFNSRPDNIYGELARIIVMDSGFKEGIDLFDIKYIHIFEPQITIADQKQVIGRGTRTCGQKGLVFHPTMGWPLFVFNYDIEINKEYRDYFNYSTTAFDIFLKSLNIDLRLFYFMEELEKLNIYGSIDYELNKNIHNFSVEQPSITNSLISSNSSSLNSTNIFIDNDDSDTTIEKIGGENSPDNVRNDTRKNFKDMREFIRLYYQQFEWKNVKMENLCGPTPPPTPTTTKNSIVNNSKTRKLVIVDSFTNKNQNKNNDKLHSLVNLSPSQDFIKHYFTPNNPIKGILLNWSVGTGKTCAAITTATSSFESNNYTILWVTRTTLKNDIWKNMFDQICSNKIKQLLLQGKTIPSDHSSRMKLLSKSWSIRPMSYRQFSNLVSKQNDMYKSLVLKNGNIDPLYKTLIIIDEAHKLYGDNNLSSLERPNMVALEQALMNSYTISGKESARLILMTATPITKDPMEVIKLINLCKEPNEQLPHTFDEFSYKYLDKDGYFTNDGKTQYLDDIAGFISYLNREKDARQFSQPIIKDILIPMVNKTNSKLIYKFDKPESNNSKDNKIKELESNIEQHSKTLKKWEGINKNQFSYLLDRCNTFKGNEKKQCINIINQEIKDIVYKAKEHINKIKNKIKDIKDEIKHIKSLNNTQLKNIRENIQTYNNEYQKFKETLYNNLKNICRKKIKDLTNINNFINDLPEIIEINKNINNTDEMMKEIELDYNNKVIIFKNKILKMKELFINSELPLNKKTKLRNTIAKENVIINNEIKNGKYKLNNNILNLKKTRKNYEKEKKIMITTIRKTLKEKLKKEKDNEKKMLKLKEKNDTNVDLNNNELEELLRVKNANIEKILNENHRNVYKNK